MITVFNVKCLMFSAILLYTLHFTHYTSFAQQVSSTELINNTRLYDGKTVVYAGEVIGDVMVRGKNLWVNLSDNKNAVGIWADISFAKEISYKGSYKSKGDWFEITGIFHRACSEHNGDLDIHALTWRKIRQGGIVQEKPDIEKKNRALILLGVLCLVLILRPYRRL